MPPRTAIAVPILGLWLATAAVAAERPAIDALGVTPGDAARQRTTWLRSDASLSRLGRITSIDERLGLPDFVWATAGEGAGAAASLANGQAARMHLERLAPLYELTAADVDAAELRHVHDTGRGGIIVAFGQTLDGVEVFRDELRVLMSRDRALVAVSGYLPRRDLARGERRLDAPGAIAAALSDFIGANVARSSLLRTRALPGGYDEFRAGVAGIQPIRVKPVLFHLPDELRPAWYLELIDEREALAYVVSAVDGGILFRHDLSADEAFTYRVWADPTAPHTPRDGPHADATPHPTGLPDFFDPPFVAPIAVSLQNGTISTNDPWLPEGAVETNGNHADAYVDLVAPDGFDAATDFRATTTAPGAFDRFFDPNQDPAISADQRMASITQAFYTAHWLHDWFYDDGFDESAGNAQASNYGRGGIEGDALRVEVQDYVGFNNATMVTPADGGRPRMQLLLWRWYLGQVHTSGPGGPATLAAGLSTTFGPQLFDVTGEIVLVSDGSGTTTDACQPIVNAVAGRIALIDNGGCSFTAKALAAQNAGAIAVLVADHVAGSTPPAMSGTSAAVTIPVLSVTLADGNALKTQLGQGAVTANLVRVAQRTHDSGIDNTTIAHEWGHHMNERLVGPGALGGPQPAGMNEGWADFLALLVAVRPGDDVDGAFGIPAGYSSSQSLVADNAYYFGVRRYPYSTDFAINPLTFRHIVNGEPLPAGPAMQPKGGGNAAPHNVGEVWCSMLWECYAALLRDTGRLSFADAQSRMKSYLVAALEMTPSQPNFTAARDALLAVAAAASPVDRAAFCMAFARRGAGSGASTSPGSFLEITGVEESFVCNDSTLSAPPWSAGLDFAIAGANPTRGDARFRFTLPQAARVEIAVFDLAGRRVATLADGEYAAGEHATSWRAAQSAGAGVYFARMKAEGRELQRRVVLLR